MSVNLHNDVGNRYYSGQGVVLIGQRDAAGNAGALFPLGNVTGLKIMISNSTTDHKGAQDGQRAIDKRLVTETKGTISFDLENLISRNLAIALRGAATSIAAGTVSAVADTGYIGAVGALPHVNVSLLVLTGTSSLGYVGGAMTEYVNDQTAWDYKWNADAGSYYLNSGSELVAPVKAAIAAGTTPTAVLTTNSLAIGSASWAALALLGTPIAVGDTVSVWGVTGATISGINGVPGVVTAVTATTVTFALPGTPVLTTGVATAALLVPITRAATGQPFAVPLTHAYSYAVQYRTDALTTAPQEMFLRFEGLNSTESQANGSFSPVVVEVFKFSVDPMKELDLINDAFAKLTIEGAILSDSTKTTGSKFFNVRQLF